MAGLYLELANIREMEVTKIDGNYTKIYVNNLLHVAFLEEELQGLQSWKEGKSWWKIEIYLTSRTIKLAYDREDKWKAVLHVLNTCF